MCYDKQIRVFEAKKWDTTPRMTWETVLSIARNSNFFKNMIEKGEYNTEYMPIGYISKNLQTKTNAKTGLVYMSGATAEKQRKNHPDLSVKDYVVVQQILDGGKITKVTKDNHCMGFIEKDKKWWRANWKVVGDEVWFLSLTKCKAREVKGDFIRE